jgi:zinc transport system permease protein
MDEKLTLVERPMSYRERIGESKLNVIHDGVRFLHTILEMTLMWRPAKVFIALAAVCLAVMMLLATLLGAVLTSGGLALSYAPDWPAGPTIIVLAGSAYFVALVAKRLWLRWRRHSALAASGQTSGPDGS